MTLTFAEQRAADLAVIFNADELGEAVTITLANGSTVATTATVDRDVTPLDFDSDGATENKQASIYVATADYSAPSREDTITFDGDNWGLLEWSHGGGDLFWRIQVGHSTMKTRGAGSSRINRF